jgi:CubicO group peptidase (beta-lactamase class C family)
MFIIFRMRKELCCMIGDPASSQWIKGNFDRVKEYLLAVMDRRKVPGVAVGIYHDGEQHLAGFGVTDVDNPLPVSVDTLFQISSVTKPIVAMAVMRLVEMNKIDLDTPIRNYLHDFHLADETVAQHVTVRHLLTHTSGWSGDFWQDMGNDDDALAKYVSRMVELPQEIEHGELYSYCNSGFYLLGRIIEVVTSMTFERAMQHFLFDERDTRWPSWKSQAHRFL